MKVLSTTFSNSIVAVVTDLLCNCCRSMADCLPCSSNFSMTLQTEILSTETSDLLKQIIILKSFNSVSDVSRTLCLETYPFIDVLVMNQPRTDFARECPICTNTQSAFS